MRAPLSSAWGPSTARTEGFARAHVKFPYCDASADLYAHPYRRTVNPERIFDPHFFK